MAAVPSLAKLNRYLVEGDLQQPASQPALPRPAAEATAFIQYTSGSTRTPAGVMVTNNNVFANFKQIMADFFGGVPPRDVSVVFAGSIDVVHNTAERFAQLLQIWRTSR